jgi:hypothetical protein
VTSCCKQGFLCIAILLFFLIPAPPPHAGIAAICINNLMPPNRRVRTYTHDYWNLVLWIESILGRILRGTRPPLRGVILISRQGKTAEYGLQISSQFHIRLCESLLIYQGCFPFIIIIIIIINMYCSPSCPMSPQIVNKFSAVYGIREFNTAFTRDSPPPPLSVFWARSINSTTFPSYFLKVHFTNILQSKHSSFSVKNFSNKLITDWIC